MTELLETFLPLTPVSQSLNLGQVLEIFVALAKGGRGPTVDSDSEKIINLYKQGMLSHASLAKAAWPALWAKATTADEKKDLSERARQILRRYRHSLT